VEHLRDHARATGRRNLFLTGRLLRLLAAFDDRRIRVIPFKGPLIATHVYGDLVVRPFSDLDVLIHARDVAAAKAMLFAHGYEQRTSHPWEAPFGDATGVEVDLHWGIGPSYDPTPRTFDQLWARAVPLPLEGVEVRSLAPEDLLLVLSIQIAKDWRGSGQRLLQICDTAELLRRYPGLDWTQVLELARTSGGERILQLDLLLSHELLSAPVPEPVLRSAQASRAARTLALELRAQMFPLPATGEASPEGPAPWHDKSTLSLRTRERWRDKLRYFILRGWQRIHLAIRPSRSDREFMRLPTRLEFLYYVVRPLRVASRRARADRISSKADSSDTAPS
jgi:hypothetical protein